MDERSIIVSGVKDYPFGGAGVPTLVDSSQPHAPAKLDCLHIFIVVEKREEMKVVCEGEEFEVVDLVHAMEVAKTLDRFVSITGDGFELVGKFGVDTVSEGRCPDGVEYTWKKRR